MLEIWHGNRGVGLEADLWWGIFLLGSQIFLTEISLGFWLWTICELKRGTGCHLHLLSSDIHPNWGGRQNHLRKRKEKCHEMFWFVPVLRWGFWGLFNDSPYQCWSLMCLTWGLIVVTTHCSSCLCIMYVFSNKVACKREAKTLKCCNSMQMEVFLGGN